MRNIEMHCHSTRSDGKNSLVEVYTEAQRKELDFIALTDHDVISPPNFQSSLRDVWIETCDSVEISAHNPDFWKSLHLVSYAKIFSESLQQILEVSRSGKQDKNKGQIEKLVAQFWFLGNYEDFRKYMNLKRKRKIETANGFDISCYMMWCPENRILAETILAKLQQKDGKTVQESFFYECLKRGGQLFEIYGFEVPEYEPSVEQTVQEVIQKSGWILSLAHPNVTFAVNKWGINEFLRTVENYVNQWVNAIEINTQANSEWVQAILYVQQKYDLLLTFGSDCHEIGYSGRDGKHASIGEQNPYVSKEQREINFSMFWERIWL